jgi:hypothetical protein
MSQRGINIVKDKIEDLELLIYGIEMRIYYGGVDQIHLTQKKQEKIHELEKLKAFLSDIEGSK